MFDAPVRILVSGLTAGQRVSIGCKVQDATTGADFETNAQYVADTAGQVDCSRGTPVGGSYTGKTIQGFP